jgi:hypothetical protein
MAAAAAVIVGKSVAKASRNLSDFGCCERIHDDPILEQRAISSRGFRHLWIGFQGVLNNCNQHIRQ